MKEELRKKMGALLKLERERLDIDRDDLAEQLKIASSNLEQIEKGTSEGLPSDIYFELFAKSYAEAIGIDYSATSEAMKDEISVSTAREEVGPAKTGAATKKTAGDDDDDVEILEEEAEDTGLGLLKKLGILLGAVAGLLIIFLVAYKMFWATDQSPAASQSSTGTTQTETGSAVDERAEFANYDWDVPPYEPPAPLVLKLRAREASWATILADGDTVIFRGLGAGRQYVVTANYRIQVSIALPRLVETELNGKLVDLRDPESRRISRVIIDQLSSKKYLEAKAPAIEENPAPAPPPSPRRQKQPAVETPPADTGIEPPATRDVIGSNTATTDSVAVTSDSVTIDTKETGIEP